MVRAARKVFSGHLANMNSVGAYLAQTFPTLRERPVASLFFLKWIGQQSRWISEAQSDRWLVQKFDKALASQCSRWQSVLVGDSSILLDLPESSPGRTDDVLTTAAANGTRVNIGGARRRTSSYSVVGITRHSFVEACPRKPPPPLDLSIVIPTFNVASTITGLLEEFHKVLTCSFEMMIVDDGSTDGTKALVEAFVESHRATVVVMDGHGHGAGSARNKALPLLRGRFTFTADSDDTFNMAHLDFAVVEATRMKVDLLMLPYKLAFVHHNWTETRGMAHNDVRAWRKAKLLDDEYTALAKVMAAFKKKEENTSALERRRLQLFGSAAAFERKLRGNRLLAMECTAYPWMRLARTSMLHEKRAMFGVSKVHNDVQYHWQTAYHAKHIEFLQPPEGTGASSLTHVTLPVVATHRKFEIVGGQQQLTNDLSADRLQVFKALVETHRALHRRSFCDHLSFVGAWQAFVERILQWASGRIPKEMALDYAESSRNLQSTCVCKPATQASSLNRWSPTSGQDELAVKSFCYSFENQATFMQMPQGNCLHAAALPVHRRPCALLAPKAATIDLPQT